MPNAKSKKRNIPMTLAEKIAIRLFTNESGERATRIILLDESGYYHRNLGGRCYRNAVDCVANELEAYAKRKIK